MQVSAKVGLEGKPTVVDYNFGNNLEEAVELFGESVIFEKFRAQSVVNLQSFIRTQQNAEKSDADIKKSVADWRPGIKKAAIPKTERLKKDFDNLSDEEKKSLLASLQGK